MEGIFMFQTKKRIICALSVVLFFGSLTMAMNNPFYDGVAGSLFAAAIGDGLGGFTEFEPGVYDGQPLSDSTKAVQQMLDRGLIRTSKDLKGVYAQRVQFLKTQGLINPKAGIAISYTDDTAMSLVVMNILLQAQQHNWDLQKTMTEMAYAFCTDYHAAKGWAAAGRAPGGACKNGIQLLETCIKNKQDNVQNWWRVGGLNAGGCGSVMRAHPFGLVFADDLEKAEKWAVEHSRLTHQDPIALASCAAMAVGTALALRQENPAVIVAEMIGAAQKYDHTDCRTVKKMRRAYEYAQMAHALMLKKSLATVYDALKNKEFVALLHTQVFHEFKGWGAHEAIAAALYLFALVPDDPDAAICLGVHTPGDSDSIASLAGALVGARAGIKKVNAQNIKDIEGRDRLRQCAHAIVTLPQFNPIHPLFIEQPFVVHNQQADDLAAQSGIWQTLSDNPLKTAFGLLCGGAIGYAFYRLYA